MNVAVVSAVFPPETVVSSLTSEHIAHGLRGHGHRVRVITSFPNRPAAKLYPGYSRRLFQKDDSKGLEVVRCFNVISAESGMLSRFLENISFGVTGGLAFLFGPKPDVIYSNTWPTFATGFLVLLARLRNVPIVISVQDMYPEQLIAQHRIETDSWIARGMFRVERSVAGHAAAIILISESLAHSYGDTRRVPSNRLHVIPNWADSGSIAVNDPEAPALRTRYGIPHDAFVAVYGGNVAFAAGVETVVEAFRSLNAVHDAHLLIAGEGANLDKCRQMAQDSANPRIRFHTPWPRSENSMVLSAADVLILPTRGAVSLAAMPSKLISYMLAARPVVALALPQSDLAQVIQGADCGWVIEPDQPQLLAETIRMVKALPEEERIRRGQAGRSYALNHLTREACVPKVIGLLEQSAHDSPLVAPDQSDQSGSQAKFTSERNDA